MIGALLPLNANANSCKIEGYTIGFFNGVATTRIDAEEGLKEIESTLDITQYNDEKVEYQLFYNDTSSDDGLTAIGDFVETFDQRTQELDQRLEDRWEAFWDILWGRQESSIIKSITSFIPNFVSFVADLISSELNRRIKHDLETLAMQADSLPNTEEVRFKHRLINDSQAWKGKKLIYIAHSQGNLWVNESYESILSQQGYDTSNIKTIHIAPASPTVNGDYILSSKDNIINGLQITGIGSVKVPNFIPSFTLNDLTGHSLIGTYLTDTQAIEMLQHSVNKAFIELQRPDMDDYLFQVTYNYTPTFSESHASPEIEFVDNNNNWVKRTDIYSENSYLQRADPNENKYELNPAKDFEPLSFIHNKKDRESQVISIDQCSDIPNDDPFILGEQSNETIRYAWDKVPPNTKVSVTVRDRYGVKLQNDEVSINELRPRGHTYQGIFIDLNAINPYTKEEKAFIKQQKLETKYELYSDSILFSISS